VVFELSSTVRDTAWWREVGRNLARMDRVRSTSGIACGVKKSGAKKDWRAICVDAGMWASLVCRESFCGVQGETLTSGGRGVRRRCMRRRLDVLLGTARWQAWHVGEMIQKRSTVILFLMMLLIVSIALLVSMHLRIRITAGTGVYAATATRGRHMDGLEVGWS
jgi:hypothetical protein